jgi:hypothetical protein
LFKLLHDLLHVRAIEDVADIVFMGNFMAFRWFVVFYQNVFYCFFGLLGVCHLRFDLLEQLRQQLARDEIVCDASFVDILALQLGASKSEVVPDVIRQPRQEVAATYIREESNLGFGHGENSVLCGNSERRKHTNADSPAHDYSVPVGDLDCL